MKNIIYIILIFCLSIVHLKSNAQSNRNYVYTKAYQEATTTSTGTFVDETVSIQEATYFDGLGRSNQSVGINQSATQNDIVTHFEYDQYGRMEKEYLAYSEGTGALGSFRTSAQTETGSYYNVPKYENTTNPYAEKEFDNSPLNRVMKQAAPGAAWAMGADHEVEMDYQTNINADNVRQYGVSLSFSNNIYTPTLTLKQGNNNRYNEGELYKSIIRNENHTGTTKLNTIEEYTDKLGRVILSRTYASYPAVAEPEEDLPDALLSGDPQTPISEGSLSVLPHDTYYVYDDYGNLTFMLSPQMNAGSNSLTTVQANINALGYKYVYDHKNRLVEKQIAGKAVEYIVYNKLDQLVMTQDGNQRLSGQWLFTKYDVFGRIAYTGVATDNRSRQQIQTEVNSLTSNLWVNRVKTPFTIGGAVIHYNNNGYPNNNITEIYTIDYYDNYLFDLAGSDVNVTAYGLQNSLNIKGLLSGSKVKVLDTNELNKWITTVNYYDDKGRIIYTYNNNNYLETTDVVEMNLDFVGKPLNTSTRHIKNGNTITTLDEFNYDHIGRLISQTQCIGGGLLCYECTASNGSTSSTTDIDKELIVLNTYDELGQLESKKVGGLANADVNTSTGLQTVDYTYNVRNWLTSINDNDIATDALDLNANDLFGFKLRYNNPLNGTALFNGNISQSLWQTQNTDNSTRQYTYAYDALDRITSAIDNTGNYDVSNIKYDKNGNIKTLNRSGWQNSNTYANMDDLVYNYVGNSLLSLNDNGNKNYGFIDRNDPAAINDYLYDANGNLTQDYNKGITNVNYSYRNLPTEVAINNGNESGTIQYVYAATGIKQRKIVSSGTTTDYAGNYVYENNELQFFSQPEGYIEPTNSGYKYVYQYKDHLGNIRLSYSDADNNGIVNASTEIVEENNYYPFGMKHKGYNEVINGRDHAYEYNGKEIDNELGLDWHHYGFRMYDPAMARFTSVDPIADELSGHSTYHYAYNNPISYIDFMGLSGTDPLPSFSNGGLTHEQLQSKSEVNGLVGQNVLPTVTVTARRKGTNYDQTPVRYGFNGTFEQWQQQYGYQGMSYDNAVNYWTQVHSSDFENWVVDEDKREAERIALQKMLMFAEWFEMIGTVVSPSGGGGPINGANYLGPKPRGFNLKTSKSSSSSKDWIAVNTTAKGADGKVLHLEFNPKLKASDFFKQMNPNWKGGNVPSGFKSSNGIKWQFYGGGTTNSTGYTIKGITPNSQYIMLRFSQF